MKPTPQNPAPPGAEKRNSIRPAIRYPTDSLTMPDMALYTAARETIDLIDLLSALSTCPGGDCSSQHSSDVAACYPLNVEIYRCDPNKLSNWTSPERNSYSRTHGI